MRDKIVHGDRSGDRRVGRGYLGLVAHNAILSRVEGCQGFRARGLPLGVGIAVACCSDHHAETAWIRDFAPMN